MKPARLEDALGESGNGRTNKGDKHVGTNYEGLCKPCNTFLINEHIDLGLVSSIKFLVQIIFPIKMCKLNYREFSNVKNLLKYNCTIPCLWHGGKSGFSRVHTRPR